MGDDVALYVVVWYDVTSCYGVSNKGEPGNHNAKYSLYSSTALNNPLLLSTFVNIDVDDSKLIRQSSSVLFYDSFNKLVIIIIIVSSSLLYNR